jgi:hypothetical protein
MVGQTGIHMKDGQMDTRIGIWIDRQMEGQIGKDTFA